MAFSIPEEDDISEAELEAIYASAQPFATDELMNAAIDQLNELDANRISIPNFGKVVRQKKA
ncbi:MAG: hypothetical protein EBV30_06945 [Actinobacteria bacterium]|nr:hypothetical protein [Actinomycetota bacterium]